MLSNCYRRCILWLIPGRPQREFHDSLRLPDTQTRQLVATTVRDYIKKLRRESGNPGPVRMPEPTIPRVVSVREVYLVTKIF
jgi:hypothetical protein